MCSKVKFLTDDDFINALGVTPKQLPWETYFRELLEQITDAEEG